MKLRRVGRGVRSKWPLYKICRDCGARKPITVLYVDLDAPPFTAYYCKRCAHSTLYGLPMDYLERPKGGTDEKT